MDISKCKYNLHPCELYSLALQEPGNTLSNTGALICSSGKITGRSPKNKRVVLEDETKDTIWWGHVNMPMSMKNYLYNKQLAINYLNNTKTLYCVDVYAGKLQYKKKFRIYSSLAYHAIFMQNMFEITPDLDISGSGVEPDFTIINAGQFPAVTNDDTPNTTAVHLCFSDKSMVILGTMYAGEMKKGIFSVLHFYYPQLNVLTLHSSANTEKSDFVSKQGATVFFGLSSTGKTSLSMDQKRDLICDDELAWSDDGLFNIECGCYAKVINLDKNKEPLIYNSIKFGTVLENVVYDKKTFEVDFKSKAITENTRASYPMTFISTHSGISGHPTNIIMLTCDAFGVLPPIAKLTKNQALYYFISGYTSTMPATVVGCTEPTPEFSACFGDAFLTLPPSKYAGMLEEKLNKHDINVWLVNTGWFGGNPKVGTRYPIAVSRGIIDNIHNNSYDEKLMYEFPIFGFKVPLEHNPGNSWTDQEAYDTTLTKLALLFIDNIKKFSIPEYIANAGPKI